MSLVVVIGGGLHSRFQFTDRRRRSGCQRPIHIFFMHDSPVIRMQAEIYKSEPVMYIKHPRLPDGRRMGENCVKLLHRFLTFALKKIGRS